MGGGYSEGEAGVQKEGSPVVSFECACGELPCHEGSREPLKVSEQKLHQARQVCPLP